MLDYQPELKACGFNQYYTVVYWVGGSEVGEWRKSITAVDQSKALEMQREIVAGGRAAYVYDDYQLQTEGMPTNPPLKWDFTNLCWKS